MNDTSPAHRRHDLSDAHWQKIENHLPGRKGVWGGVAKNNRQFVNAVLWVVRTGAPWRDLPSDYGGWSNTHRRFIRWRDKGLWEKLFEVLIDEPDMAWLMIDASHVRSIPTRPARAAETRTWASQKGAQHQGASGRGCVWSSAPSTCYGGFRCGLHPG